ncbi:MAG TPA: hypothetical protein VES02_09640 [Dermatophilaceae bacterium]|nr:hypothetical protein [Dermatophilaceae bacterium]
MSGQTQHPRIDLYWLPLGAGGRSVRWNGRIFEAVMARREHRAVASLYHSALEVRDGASRFVIEMAPVWNTDAVDRGVVREGPVGTRWLGRSRLFRYEVRCWLDGQIPDVAEAVASPRLLSTDRDQVARLIDILPTVPSLTWGRDALGAGDMWNSNSLISWSLARTGNDMTAVCPPARGRAPGWQAGLVLASRQAAAD